MRTPASKVETIRRLFADATPGQREAFDLRTADPVGFQYQPGVVPGDEALSQLRGPGGD